MSNQAGPMNGRVRPVDSFNLYGEPLSFRELCEKSVGSDTDYVVLDLDHTVHLRRNMGEIFAWELSVHQAYEASYLKGIEASRGPGRGHLGLTRPLGLLRYGQSALQHWALPGLFYFFWAKMVCASRWTDWLAYRVFGTEPRSAIQSVPQRTLFRVMAGMSLESLRAIARSVWRRHQDEQVITREDIVWLKARCPKLTVILSSASPQPVLEVAAEELGVDAVLYSRVGECDGYVSTPLWRRALRKGLGLPTRISTPDEQLINARSVKVARLSEAFPDIFEPATITIGMTDTGYGEDHCWADCFDAVVDINSSDPFPPIVPSASPLREIHSALVLTQAELARVEAGSDDILDPRRGRPERSSGLFEAQELRSLLAKQLSKLEVLGQRYERRERQLIERRGDILNAIKAVQNSLRQAVSFYNGCEQSDRREALASVRAGLNALESYSAELIAIERPLASLTWETEAALQSSRCVLAGALA